MLIPLGPPGSPAEDFPTLYPSRLKAYGVAPMFDQVRGCPALYKARYVTCSCGHPRDQHYDDGPGGAGAGCLVDDTGDDGRTLCPCPGWHSSIERISEHGSPLEFGGAVHEALFHMEQHGTGPDEALRETWPPALGLDRWREASDLLEKYLERGGPMARYATLGVEIELFAELYIDDDHGPIWFGGILDWLGVDTNLTQQLHVADYKTNAQPLSRDEVEVDAQLRGYDWLVHRNWSTTLGMPGAPSTIAHMDGLRWQDVDVQFTADDRAEWEAWAIAAARTILRDEKAPEIISEGCRWCDRKLRCSAYARLPGQAEAIKARREGKTAPELWGWRREAATAVSLLEKGIKETDAILVGIAEQEGPFVVDDQRWAMEDVESDRIDAEQLHSVIGDVLFYDAASITKKSLDQIKRAHPDLAVRIDECVSTMVVDRKVKRKKVKPDA